MGRARESRSTFRLEIAVDIDIDAPAARVWALLTDAARFPSWNSTVTSIEGAIREGETVAVKMAIAPERVFRLEVGEVVPEKQMVWSDGNFLFGGRRTYRLLPSERGVRFEMSEVFSGWMLPLIARSLPDFGPTFERYAEDLKAAAEAG